MPSPARSRRRPFPRVRVTSGPAFEVVAQLAAFGSGPARASLEAGKPWIRDVRSLAGPELIRRVEQWALPLYAELAPIALETGPPFGPDALVERLRSLEPDVLRRRLIGADSVPNRAMVTDGAFERALDRDAAAAAELRWTLGLNAPARRSIDGLLTMPPAEIQADVSAIVHEWATRVFPAFAERALGLVGRDVESKEDLLRMAPPRDVVARAVNAVEFDPGDWADEIVLVPTVALRPFLAPVESGALAIVLYPVSDDVLGDDPSAPPRRLVKVAAALGDEVRLRVLRELRAGDMTATELATRLGMDRTSLHHHLGILRSAGLVSARAEGVRTWRYALRSDGLDGMTSSLARYLRTDMSDGGATGT